MGLLDNIAGQALGGATSGTQSNLVGEILGMLGGQQSGGLAGLVQQFAGKGLGNIINSWVSTGQNLPITPQQVEHGLGGDVISQLAAKLGVAPGEITQQLSSILPNVVDKLTPDGKIPEQSDLASKGMSILEGLFK